MLAKAFVGARSLELGKHSIQQVGAASKGWGCGWLSAAAMEPRCGKLNTFQSNLDPSQMSTEGAGAITT